MVDLTGTVIGWELQHKNLYFGLGLGIAAFAVLGYSGYWMYALNVDLHRSRFTRSSVPPCP